MYRKNTASQFLTFQGVDVTTGGIKSGVTWTVRRCIDGTFAAGGGTVTEDGTTGFYKYAMSQADTNGNNVGFNFTGTGAVPQTVNIITDGSPPDVNTVKIGGTTQTARDLGASVLISVGTGTGQLDLSSGKVLLQATQTGVTIPTVTTVTNDVGITQAGADKVWTSTTRTLTAFSTALAVSVWDVLTANIGTASSIGLKLKNWVLGSDNKVLLSSDAQTSVTIPTVTTLTNAPSDSSGVTTLLSRLSALRAGYLDNLSAGAVALESSLQSLITTVGAAGAGIASAVWSAATRVLTAGTNIVLAKGTGLTGLNDLSAAQVKTQADNALADYDGPTHTEMTTELATADDAVLAAIAALDSALVVRRGTAQSGATLYTIILDAGASTDPNFYAKNIIFIMSGTGAGQARRIQSYSGVDQTVTVDSGWAIVPDDTSEYVILPDADVVRVGTVGEIAPSAATTIANRIWEDDNSVRTTTDSAGNKLRQALILYEGN